jgi:hypothetical protein
MKTLRSNIPEILMIAVILTAALTAGVFAGPVSIPWPFASSELSISRSGDVRLTVLAESPSNETALLDVQTGAAVTRFSVDEDGDVVIVGSLSVNGTVMTTTPDEIDQALQTITLGGTVTAANLNSLDGGGEITLHTHSGGGAGSVPANSIAMWAGTIATIPSGWVLCDGTNSTPDLRDHFVRGASVSAEDAGSSHTVVLSTANLPSHSHTGGSSLSATGTHTHTGASDSPSHQHQQNRATSQVWADAGGTGTAANWWGGLPNNTTNWTGAHTHSVISWGNGGSHTHSLTSGTAGSSSAFDHRPPYYKLAFIMKQ